MSSLPYTDVPGCKMVDTVIVDHRLERFLDMHVMQGPLLQAEEGDLKTVEAPDVFGGQIQEVDGV